MVARPLKGIATDDELPTVSLGSRPLRYATFEVVTRGPRFKCGP